MIRRDVYILILAFAAGAYFRFMYVRSMPDVISNQSWPRGFPYPDYIVLWFHDLIDKARPAIGDQIKLDGEWYTVSMTFLAASNFFFFFLVGLFFGIRALKRCTDLADVEGPR